MTRIERKLAETEQPRILIQTELPADQAAPPKRGRGDPIKKLRKASAQKVRDNSEKIAQALLDQTLNGDVGCAKLLFALTENTEPSETTKKPEPYRSLAEELANS